MKFRKKPVVVEAFQMTHERRQSHKDWPVWLHQAWLKDKEVIGSLYPEDYPESNGNDRLRITTLEGNQLVSWGDYIIQGVQGEIYPCKPDIFDATYERVDA